MWACRFCLCVFLIRVLGFGPMLDAPRANLLSVEPGSCAFYHQRRTKTEDGRVYEYTRSYIRGDRVRLDVHMQKSGMTFSRIID